MNEAKKVFPSKSQGTMVCDAIRSDSLTCLCQPVPPRSKAVYRYVCAIRTKFRQQWRFMRPIIAHGTSWLDQQCNIKCSHTGAVRRRVTYCDSHGRSQAMPTVCVDHVAIGMRSCQARRKTWLLPHIRLGGSRHSHTTHRAKSGPLEKSEKKLKAVHPSRDYIFLNMPHMSPPRDVILLLLARYTPTTGTNWMISTNSVLPPRATFYRLPSA